MKPPNLHYYDSYGSRRNKVVALPFHAVKGVRPSGAPGADIIFSPSIDAAPPALWVIGSQVHVLTLAYLFMGSQAHVVHGRAVILDYLRCGLS